MEKALTIARDIPIPAARRRHLMLVTELVKGRWEMGLLPPHIRLLGP